MAGLVNYRNTMDLLDVAIVIDGEVIEVLKIRQADGPTYKPVIRYSDHHGTEREYVPGFATNPPAYFVGEKVQLLYDPKDPKYPLNIRIHDGFGLWFTAVGLSGFGGFFILVAGLMWFLYMKGGEYPVRKKPTNPMDGYDF